MRQLRIICDLCDYEWSHEDIEGEATVKITHGAKTFVILPDVCDACVQRIQDVIDEMRTLATLPKDTEGTANRSRT